MKIILIMTFILISNLCGQNSGKYSDSVQIIDSKDFYSGEGVIFPKTSECLFIRKCLTRFTPTVENVREAEEIMINSQFTPKDYDTNKVGFPSPNIIKNFYRQYWGFTDSSGSRIILINYVNIKNTLVQAQWKKFPICINNGGGSRC